MFSILGSNALKSTMARELPAYALAPTSMRVAGEPDLVLDAVERLYGLLGVVEKREPFSVLASFEHPDGMWVLLRSKLYFDSKGLILETMKRRGDSFLAALLYTCLTDMMRCWTIGLSYEHEDFQVGQIIPRLPASGPAEPPTNKPPPLSLGSSFHEAWDRPAVQAFLHVHERLAARIRAGKRVSRKVFKRHVERIPAVVLMDKKATCGTEPSKLACDVIDEWIADALLCWAYRE
jgi:hypothetical protein